jgi:hypothetical protein
VNGETPDAPLSTEPELPGFFVAWRDGFGPDAADFSPLDYLNQEQAVPFVIATRWLFCPDLTEYRDCVVVVKNVLKNRAVDTEESGLAEHDKAIVDDWLTALGDDRPAVEAKVNLLNVADLFASVDTAPFENDLPGLAGSIAECSRCVTPTAGSPSRSTTTTRAPDRSSRSTPPRGSPPPDIHWP